MNLLPMLQQGPTTPEDDTSNFVDPNRALWAGTIMDITGFLASGGRQPSSGIGTQMFLQAQQYNQSQDQLRRQRQDALREQQVEQERWQAEQDLAERQLAATAGGSANVHSAFRGDDGFMYTIDKQGNPRNTGVQYASGFSFQSMPDGSVMTVSKQNGQPVGWAVSPDAARDSTLKAGEINRQLDAIAELPQAEARFDQAIASADNVIATAKDAIAMVGPWTSGASGAVLGQIPGTEAMALTRTVGTIKANLGFDRLQRMRENSPTGGALGQVAVQELEALQSALASLDTSLPAPQLTANLQKVIAHYEGWKKAVEQNRREMQERAGEDGLGAV